LASLAGPPMVVPPFRLKQHDQARGTFGQETHSRAVNLVAEDDCLGRRAVSAQQQAKDLWPVWPPKTIKCNDNYN
jgi:hypothetical protein